MYACAISRPARAQGGGARVAVQLVDIASAQYYSLTEEIRVRRQL